MKKYLKCKKSFQNIQKHEMYETVVTFWYDGKNPGTYYVVIVNDGFGDVFFTVHSKYFE